MGAGLERRLCERGKREEKGEGGRERGEDEEGEEKGQQTRQEKENQIKRKERKSTAILPRSGGREEVVFPSLLN